LLGVGLATMAMAGWAALRETDMKRILAYGTVAQLGLLAALASNGTTLAAGTALLLAHAGFKAALFLVVGIIDRSTGSRDIRALGGLRRSLPAAFWIAIAAGASMAGIPGTLGFVAKEAALDTLVGGEPLTAWLITGGSILTVGYTLRLLMVFTGPDHGGRVHPVRATMLAPAAFLAAAGVVLGLFTAPVASLTDAVAAVSGVRAVPLPAWPGIKPALGLSLLALALGPALTRIPLPSAGRAGRRPADRAFDGVMTGLLLSARRVTATLQNGSLPVYLVVILLTIVTVPGVALIGGAALPDGLTAGESWVQLALAAAAVAGAAGLAAMRNRLGAVLLLGVVGYAMAGLFALQGAPDLALTQVLVETMTLVIFAVVLARLPERFSRSRRPAIGPVVRVLVALAVGGFVTAGLYAAGAARTAEPASTAYLERSLPEGNGRNVVNVILTDFRALDTFGEIAVVATAAIGIAGLISGLRRRSGGGS
jgi:multicomponent Na+:H+ antiporter subunit A